MFMMICLLHLPVDSRLQLVEDYAMLILPHGAGEDVRF